MPMPQSINKPVELMQKPEVCGKFLTCRPRCMATTLLPAVSVHEKDGVLEGSEICRILPSAVFRSAVKNRDLSTRPLFWASTTCGFVAKNQGVLGGFRFFPRTSEKHA